MLKNGHSQLSAPLRKAKKISQEELATLANCDISSLGRTERGEVSPTVRMVERLALALDVSMIKMFDFSELRGSNDQAARLKEQIDMLIRESDPKTLDLLSLVLADFTHHGRKHRS